MKKLFLVFESSGFGMHGLQRIFDTREDAETYSFMLQGRHVKRSYRVEEWNLHTGLGRGEPIPPGAPIPPTRQS